MVAKAVYQRPAGVLLNEEAQFVPEGFAKKAVDNGVETAVGESCQVDNVPREGVVMPQGDGSPLRWVRFTLQQLDADEDVFWQPADEEDEYHDHDHAQSFLPARPQSMVLLGLHEDSPNQGVAQADDGEWHQKADGYLKPLDLVDVGEAEVQLTPVLRLHDGEREKRGQNGSHPNETTAELCMLHGPQWAAVHGARQGHVSVKAHPGEEEDAAVHVDLQEEGHEGAEDRVVVIFLVQIENLNEGIRHQDEVCYSEVHKVDIRDGHLLSVVQVHHQYQDVANKSNGKEEDGVQAGQEKTSYVRLVLVWVFTQICAVECIWSVQWFCGVVTYPHQSRSLPFHANCGGPVSKEPRVHQT